MPDKPFNPYVDRNYNDVSKRRQEVYAQLLNNIQSNPEFHASLLADLYMHWKVGTFETPLMHEFAETI